MLIKRFITLLIFSVPVSSAVSPNDFIDSFRDYLHLHKIVGSDKPLELDNYKLPIPLPETSQKSFIFRILIPNVFNAFAVAMTSSLSSKFFC